MSIIADISIIGNDFSCGPRPEGISNDLQLAVNAMTPIVVIAEISDAAADAATLAEKALDGVLAYAMGYFSRGPFKAAPTGLAKNCGRKILKLIHQHVETSTTIEEGTTSCQDSLLPGTLGD